MVNGWERFSSCVTRLERALDATDDVLVEGSIGPRVVELKKLLKTWGKQHPFLSRSKARLSSAPRRPMPSRSFRELTRSGRLAADSQRCAQGCGKEGESVIGRRT